GDKVFLQTCRAGIDPTRANTSREESTTTPLSPE
uniref:Uncharacterized protein n=1 Tax=Parascaris univalens TaxID=6257 RepID=A0A915BQ91_PARUN